MEDPDRQRLVRIGKAVGHPLRAEILLSALSASGESPCVRASVVARRLEQELRLVAYHVKILVELGFLEPVGSVRIRGAVATDYRLTDDARAAKTAMNAMGLDR